MTELWLIRHGQTDWNLEGRYQGQSDVPLNVTGLAQAEALAATLEGQSFAALWSSDLQRAFQTAQIIAIKVGLGVQTDVRLREINQGEWQGRTLDQIRAAYYQESDPAQPDLIDPAEARAPGGESVLEVGLRMAQAADDIAGACAEGPVLVVSHGLALAALYCQAKGIPLRAVYSYIARNTQARVIEWRCRR